MRLSQQLILFMLAAAVLPLSGVGFWLLNRTEAELTRRIEGEQRAVAEAAAESAGAQLMSAVDSVANSAKLINWRAVTEQEAQGGLLLAAQSPVVAGAALHDPQAAAPARAVAGGEGHPAFDPATDGDRLKAAMPLDSLGVRGQREDVAVGLALELSGGVGLPVAVQVTPPDKDAAFVVAFLGLGPVAERLKQRASPTVGELELIDADGRVLASSQAGAALRPLTPSRLEVVTARLVHARSSDRERVAVAAVPDRLNLKVVVSLPEDIALAPLRAQRRTVLGGIAATLVLLVGVGLWFTGRLNRRLNKVGGVADAWAKGELSTRIEVGGQDELTELADTFNRMGVELEAARGRLLKWNDDLKVKVDEATADLRSAQAQLLEAQKLAAIGQLGAGVAHEINNPLCGILGNAQLLMLDRDEGSDDFDLLKKIEESAKRCRDITQNLLRFSQSNARAERRPVDLNAVVRSAIAFERPRFEEAKVAVAARLHQGPLMTWADPELISQVISALSSNARTAMLKTERKQMDLGTREVGGEVQLAVRDTGKGITPEHLPRIFEPFFTTKDVWSNIGLGLSVVYRIITEHEGKIDVESVPGKGALFIIHLPKYDPAKHRPVAQLAKNFNAGGQGVGIVR